MKPLLYLTLRRLVNALKRIPKNPLLLLPTLFLGFVFAWPVAGFFWAGGQWERPEMPAPAWTLAPREMVEGEPGALAGAVRVLLLLSVFGSVVAALGEGNLFFGPSDIDFLFPAPLRRRAVLLFKMAGTYASLLVPTAYLPLFLGGPLARSRGLTPLAYWPGMVAAWLFLLAAANLTQTALLSRARDTEEKAGAWPKALRLVGVLLFLGGLVVVYRFALDEEGNGLVPFLRAINSQLVSRMLFPVAWVSDLFLVAFRGWDEQAVAKLGGLAAASAASFALLFARDRDFYEAALEVSARRQRVVAATQTGDTSQILSQIARERNRTRGESREKSGQGTDPRVLRAFGSGALGVVWRDLVTGARTPLRSWVALLVIAALPALVAQGVAGPRGDTAVLFWIVLFVVNVSGVFLTGIRTMLRRADITKALPIAPARFLLGETAVSIALLTVFGWMSLALMTAFGVGYGPQTPVAFWALPSLAALVLLVQTCFVLLYPNRNDPAQNTIGNLLGFGASLLALLPTVVVGVVLFGQSYPPPAIALGVSLTNLAAAAAALWFGAFLWQRFDPTD